MQVLLSSTLNQAYIITVNVRSAHMPRENLAVGLVQQS
jgi:hypothetical protein